MGASKSHRSPVASLVMFLLPLCISCRTLNGTISDRPNDASELGFPPNFLFGVASSSYQYEGAYLADGKGLGNWDVFTHNHPGRINDASNGDVAVDHYHRYLEDISIMKDIGVNTYRFSISWSRILPKGRFSKINSKAIDFYNRLIDALLSLGIEPFVTLTHYDYPQELDDRYGMWLSRKSVEDFVYYAEICFKYFGDRVKYWTTFNEPNYQAINGYRTGIHPPGRCSEPFGNCSAGDSETEPFIAAHHMILSHAAAVNVYRTNYQKKQGGVIGIVLHAFWFEPLSSTYADILATRRAQAFFFDWILEPIVYGRYPRDMQEIVGPNLPKFSTSEFELLKETGLDFIGINHYSAWYVKDCLYSACESVTSVNRGLGSMEYSHLRNGVPIGEPTTVDWLYVYPEGMEKMVNYVKEKYHNTPIYITENGFGEVLPLCTLDKLHKCISDHDRVDYMAKYTKYLQKAIRNGADVRGYMSWSLLDNFEWAYGYTVRFGLCHVDYATLKRTPRLSARWYKEFIANHTSVLQTLKHDGQKNLAIE